ncbi:MAG: TIGR04282 family arsenosugar biosynthesis glycosyltransferase [Aerococcus sp.]|nr:TIGR04282 family arsenosugar biosynthesis glycosyltransferase [Aerococcus sp.]
MKNVVIIFTRLPIQGETKSRLRDFLDPRAIQQLSQYLLTKNYQAVSELPYDIQFWVTSRDESKTLADYLDYDPSCVTVHRQIEGDLGQRMAYAMDQAQLAGYDKVVLMGTDLYDLSTDHLTEAFRALDYEDIVLAPTYDGGYGLIGWKQSTPSLFEISGYGGQSVYRKVITKASQAHLQVHVLPRIHDIDTKEDIARVLTKDEDATFLAQGEYNANFRFHNGTRLLRIALGSQLHLAHQIAYEYHALEGLQESQVTPIPRQLVEDEPLIHAGYLVEDYLPGRPLDYRTDSANAAKLLARVHQVPRSNCPELILADQPFQVMMDEFHTMFRVYQEWDQRDLHVEQRIQNLLDRLGIFALDQPLEHPCIINTELNSSNFLINHDASDSYIIDWEKPLIGEREQDLGHFLAPTTTRWKTDYLYDRMGIQQFVVAYNAKSEVAIDEDKLTQYLLFTCLRGLTWCAMAYVQYQSQTKVAQSQATYKVIKNYLSDEFLTMIERYFDELLGYRGGGRCHLLNV